MAHVRSYSQRDKDGIFLYSNGNRIGGPYNSEEEATQASKLVSQMVGEAPVEDYIGFLKGPIRSKEFEGRPQNTPPETRSVLEDLKGAGSGLLDFLITPTSTLADRPPRSLIEEESPSLFNTNFITEMPKQPEWRVEENKDFLHYAPDMGNVDFGGVLPSRENVENLILEASSIAGVRPEFTEGYRTLEQNKLVGGHAKSKHILEPAQAFDLAISGDIKKDRLYEKELERLFHPLGFSVVLKGDHIHLQKPRPGG